MIVGRVVEEWDHGVWLVRSDPACQMIVCDQPCGRPATVRRNYWPYWSQFWCPEHATAFDDEYGPKGYQRSAVMG